MTARVLLVDDSPTLLRVVSTILERAGYETLIALDGEEALALLSELPVDLILLDFVMPRMNGYQFCRALRDIPGLPAVPVVLMSAKADKIREQFLRQTGAADAITKPFSGPELLSVVGAALAHNPPRTSGEGDDEPPSSAADPQLFRPSRVSLSDDPEVRRAQEAEEFSTALGRLFGPEFATLPDVDANLLQNLERAMSRALTPDSFSALERLLKTLRGNGPSDALSGDLSALSIAEVLQFLDLQRLSGALAISTGAEEVTLYIERGKLDYAVSRGLRDEFRLGRYLVEDGAVTREELNNVLSQASGSQRLLGETLVNLGLIEEARLKSALLRQTSEMVYEVARWRSGRFTFTLGAQSPIAAKTALNLETVALVMEAFRRVDEWRMMEDAFELDEVLYQDPAALERLGKELNLSGLEQTVLNAIDGERTVREIVKLLEGSSFELCKVLHQLLNSRLVRRRAA